jgi:FtsP/CotA-like multicopper oxidase with cupredoxin domain
MPAELRPLPAWTAGLSPTPTKTWTIGVGQGIKPAWLINGRTFDPGFAEETLALGETVIWRLRNRTAVAHLLHLHHTDWYMLERNGKTPPAWERCLKDTFLLDPYDDVVIAGKASDYTGMYVVHCHMLDHEDHGLMSQFEVTA